MRGQADQAAGPPRTIDALRDLLLRRQASLPKRLVQVANYMVNQADEIAFGTVAEIAAKAQVQSSTMVRFAQALGYTGFSDLQAVFRGHARDRWPEYRERIEALHETHEDDDVGHLLHSFIHASTQSVERLQRTIKAETLDRAVGYLSKADTIYLLGNRRSFPVSTYLAYALRKLGIRCDLVDQMGGLAPEHMALVRPGDVVLAISYAPYTPLTLELSAEAFAAGIPVVAITDSPFSPLLPSATVWLEVAEADHAAFRSLAASFTLATTLAVAIAGRRESQDNAPAGKSALAS